MDKLLKEQRKQARQLAKTLDTLGQRMCTKCGGVKLHSHMKKDSKRPYGIQRICKDCDNVVWPKHARYRKEREKNRTGKVLIDWKSHLYNPPLVILPSTDAPPTSATTPMGLAPHPDKTLLVTANGWGKPENKEWWDTFFQHAKKIGDNDLPDGLKPKPAMSVMDVAPVDPQAIAMMDQAIPKPTHPFWSTSPHPTKPNDWSDIDPTLLDKFADEQLAEPPPTKRYVNMGLIPHTDIKDAVDAGTYRIAIVEESEAQTALRRKMNRDGFSVKMVDMAVKLLPKILKDLKELDTL